MIDARDIQAVLIKARNAETDPQDYQVYEAALDAINRHSVIRAVRDAALTELARMGFDDPATPQKGTDT